MFGFYRGRLARNEKPRIYVASKMRCIAPHGVDTRRFRPLDAASKAMVEETLNDGHGGKTILMIAHNLVSITAFDQFLVLQYG